ncbi:MAG: cellulase family glycosylhydrolase [Eubacteriales bacterium]
MEKISTRDTMFIDNFGRERIFHGFNVVDKGDYKDGKVKFDFEFDDAFFDKFKEKGFNILRLGFGWNVVEPKPLKYNEDFLNAVGVILDKCAEKGVFVYLDIHQDCYSSFCYGNGAPAWATLMDKYKPRPAKFVWAELYFRSKAVHRAFDNFWTNRQYNDTCLQDYYAGMWKHIADKFKDKPALFGFDFMNEPYPGKDGGKVFRKLVYKCARVMLADRGIKRSKLISDALHKDRRMKVLDQLDAPIFNKITSAGNELVKKFDIERYSPFLNKMTSAVRKVTDNGIVFIDNSYWSNIGIPCSNLPIEVGGKREAKQCFQPHGYDLMVDTPAYKYASNSRVGAIFAEHKRTQERLNVPAIVGEWGGGGEGTEWLPHVEFLLETFEKNKWSYTYWHYSKGVLDSPLSEVLVRPYPKAVTGEIIEFFYIKEQDVFKLVYKQEKVFDAPTVIYVPKPFKSIIVDGEYTAEKIENSEAANVNIKTGVGMHTVEIRF